MTPEVRDRLLELERMLREAPRIRIPLDGHWEKPIPARGGVYAIWQGDKAVYVGETCHLKHRFGDLVRSGTHGFRRKLAKILNIELARVGEELARNHRISFLADFLGRSELEEFLTVRWLPEYKLGRLRYCDDFNEIGTA